MKFSETSLHPDLLKAITKMGIEVLTPIQEKTLEPALAGENIAGAAQTGTGKTIAFLLPILQHIFKTDPSGPTALIITPTRELCLQIAEESQKLCSNYRKVKICALYGGEGYNKQEAALKANPAIIVATPGRLIDYLRKKKITTKNLRFTVLDEADRMLDMGFVRDVEYIMREVPKETQVMLFSATLSSSILRLARRFMHNDMVEVRIKSKGVAVDRIEQKLIHIGRDEKNPYIVNQIREAGEGRMIVFTNYRHRVDRITRTLRRYGISAMGISSLLRQKRRENLLKRFKSGECAVLVATDVASRGLDIDDLTHVFNYDLPQDAEAYVHRIGRTARAGKDGKSISYCSEEDYVNLPRIERYITRKIPVESVKVELLDFPREGFEALPELSKGGSGSSRSGYRSRNRSETNERYSSSKQNGRKRPDYNNSNLERGSRSGNRVRPERDSRSGNRARPEKDSRSDNRARPEKDSRSGNRARPERDSRSGNRAKSERDSRSGNRAKSERDSRSGNRAKSDGKKPYNKKRRSSGKKQQTKKSTSILKRVLGTFS